MVGSDVFRIEIVPFLGDMLVFGGVARILGLVFILFVPGAALKEWVEIIGGMNFEKLGEGVYYPKLRCAVKKGPLVVQGIYGDYPQQYPVMMGLFHITMKQGSLH